MYYFDNAATTKPYDECLDVYTQFSKENWFNPSALYFQSVETAKIIKGFRDDIKHALGASDSDDLYFTSGGSESDNWSLFASKKQRGGKIIVSLGEHDAIINPANELKAQGFDVQFAPINKDGSVNVDEFKEMLDESVCFVSIMHVSNETGAVNDIGRLVKLVKKANPDAIFHSDGVQAFCKIPVNVRALGVDLYSISGHKIHAPKGIGALYVKNGTRIKPFIFGGGQEKGMRSGTENLPLIASFAKAVEINQTNFDENYSKKMSILDILKSKLIESMPSTVIISPEKHAPHVLTVAFDGIRGEVLLHSVEKDGLMVGIGSACSSHHESRFKSLLGLDEAHRDGIIRFSVSEFNSVDEVNDVVEIISKNYKTLVNYARK